MKLIILALILSIFLHLLIFNTYKKSTALKNNNKEKIIHKKNNITYVKIKKAAPIKKIKKAKVKVKKKKTIQKKVIRKKVSKKLIKLKKPIRKQKKAIKTKNTVKKPSLENFLTQNDFANNTSKIQKNTLENFLKQEEPVNRKMLSQLERLYGREFETFTKVQKAFLKKNIGTFQEITQKVLNRLGYPRLAGKLRISGTNIVEFDFYPNGAIKNLKITSSSGYTIFDEYTLELIQIAYKDYPKPKTITKLRFNVNYKLY